MEDRRDKNNKISKGLWNTVKTKVGKFRIAETKREREKRRRKSKETGAKAISQMDLYF